jgi:hypothetical protein
MGIKTAKNCEVDDSVLLAACCIRSRPYHGPDSSLISVKHVGSVWSDDDRGRRKEKQEERRGSKGQVGAVAPRMKLAQSGGELTAGEFSCAVYNTVTSPARPRFADDPVRNIPALRSRVLISLTVCCVQLSLSRHSLTPEAEIPVYGLGLPCTGVDTEIVKDRRLFPMPPLSPAP